MNQPRLPQFLSLALAGVMYFTFAANAEAGFIVSTADPAKNLLSVEEDSSSSAPANETPIPPKYDDQEPETIPNTGMSSPSAGNAPSGGAAVAALPAVPIDIPTLLITHLGPEGRVWLPPPFSTGVFRPPRFV